MCISLQLCTIYATKQLFCNKISFAFLMAQSSVCLDWHHQLIFIWSRMSKYFWVLGNTISWEHPAFVSRYKIRESCPELNLVRGEFCWYICRHFSQGCAEIQIQMAKFNFGWVQAVKNCQEHLQTRCFFSQDHRGQLSELLRSLSNKKPKHAHVRSESCLPFKFKFSFYHSPSFIPH